MNVQLTLAQSLEQLRLKHLKIPRKVNYFNSFQLTTRDYSY
ncbi:MAG: hypothetical protein OFPII_32780 [Osedax symbiont Rs1]|nr:MAG: hypothetical protein OFPII_32780 [Osedax symbiont Rs1]